MQTAVPFIRSLPFKLAMNQQSGPRELNRYSLSLRAPTEERTPVGRNYPHPSIPILGPTQRRVKCVPGLFPEGRAGGVWR